MMETEDENRIEEWSRAKRHSNFESLTSHILIAKRSTLCIHEILYWARPSCRQFSQIDLVCYLHVRGGAGG